MSDTCVSGKHIHIVDARALRLWLVGTYGHGQDLRL